MSDVRKYLKNKTRTLLQTNLSKKKNIINQLD